MFLRFITTEIDEESHKELGVFQAASRLRDRHVLSPAEEVILQEIRDWFNQNLEKPKRFTNAKPPFDRKRKNGISWIKDTAHEHIGKMREMVALLKHHDVLVHMIKSDRPGYVVYEDEFQIVAVPFADSNF